MLNVFAAQMEAARIEASANAAILSEAQAELSACKVDLFAVLEEARSKGLGVRPDCGFSWTWSGPT